MSGSYIQSQMDCPILFRTLIKDVYNFTFKNGSIWLRSERYYRDIEDIARKDPSEGSNGAKTLLPLNVKPSNGPQISITGNGKIGQAIVPHYIMSLHGTSISEREHKSFGGCTLGVKSISSLAAEVLYKISKKISVHGYRFGQVDYKYTSLVQSYSGNGAAINLGGQPNIYLKSINTDVLRKDPVRPFIEQDEWELSL